MSNLSHEVLFFEMRYICDKQTKLNLFLFSTMLSKFHLNMLKIHVDSNASGKEPIQDREIQGRILKIQAEAKVAERNLRDFCLQRLNGVDRRKNTLNTPCGYILYEPLCQSSIKITSKWLYHPQQELSCELTGVSHSYWQEIESLLLLLKIILFVILTQIDNTNTYSVTWRMVGGRREGRMILI